MFHDIPPAYAARMAYLEDIDVRDRQDGTPRLQRLRQIPPETGRFIALIASSAPPGQFVEIGTSAGYSSLWISLACRKRGQKLTTFEILDEKVRLAQDTFATAGAAGFIDLVHGDARQYLPDLRQIAFCFLDTDKEIYLSCYEIVVPNLVSGGWIIADNALNHADQLKDFIERALQDPRLDAMIVTQGKGLLVGRKR